MSALLVFACSGDRSPVTPVLPSDSSAFRDSASGDSIPRDSTSPDSATRDTAGPALAVEAVVTGLSMPVYLTAPAGDPRLFIVELEGRIEVVKGGQVLPTPFLDISDRTVAGGERGLLSLAFHPSYAANGFFYVFFTDRDGDVQVERFHVSANPDVADKASAKRIFSLEHSSRSNHNGGMLRFGPDGMLYIGTGDGGGAGDPDGNGQNRWSLAAKLLRVDVDRGDPYAIPSDNPFAGEYGGEIWALGLRNPWRYAFDPAAGTLYVADVGQNQWEEVNVVPANRPGVNYGWNVTEGLHCFDGSANCAREGLTSPVLEYSHSDGCSITGGVVYRGRAVPRLRGHYFYSDFCAGWLRSFRYANGQAVDQQSWNVGPLGFVTSFGEDGAGELYILSASGKAYRFKSS